MFQGHHSTCRVWRSILGTLPTTHWVLPLPPDPGPQEAAIPCPTDSPGRKLACSACTASGRPAADSDSGMCGGCQKPRAHTYFRSLLTQAPGLGLCPPSSGPSLSGRCNLVPRVGHGIKRSSHQFFGIFLPTGSCLVQVGPEFPTKSPPPREPWWCSLPSLGSTGRIPTAVRKAGCIHPSTATFAYLLSTSRSLPAHSCTVCHPNAPHMLPGQASVYQSR